jgi:hypothetical protein
VVTDGDAGGVGKAGGKGTADGDGVADPDGDGPTGLFSDIAPPNTFSSTHQPQPKNSPRRPHAVPSRELRPLGNEPWLPSFP